MKKLILLAVDGLSGGVTAEMLSHGLLPNLGRLADAGAFRADCSSVFPSLTPCANASIVTGHLPDRHQVPATMWYNRKARRVVYYGDTTTTSLTLGLGRVALDYLHHLNHSYLSPWVETIFERLHSLGRTTAGINSIIHRGPVRHRLKLPWWVRLLPGAPNGHQTEVSAPGQFYFGDFIPSGLGPAGILALGGPFQRFGINDAYSWEVLRRLIERGLLADFTLCYLPDTDFITHRQGYEGTRTSLLATDRELGKTLALFPSFERMLGEVVWMLVSDHGHSPVFTPEERAAVRLEGVLSGFELVAHTDRDWDCRAGVLICQNARACQLYLGSAEPLEDVVRALTRHEKVELICWREGESYLVWSGENGSLLAFRPGGPWMDPGGRGWHMEGDQQVFRDLGIERAGRNLKFSRYPDLLRRVAGCLESPTSGQVWLCAKEGFEFQAHTEATHHGGASHGSLHAVESHVPLLVSEPEVAIPQEPSIVDICDLVLQLQGFAYGREAAGVGS